jgi:hypothetical protein
MAQTPLVQDRYPLNEVKYAGRDYPTIFDALLRRLKTEYSDIYNDYAESSVGIMLIDLCASAAGWVSWYMDRRMSDAYLPTVRTTTAASWLTRSLGYKMSPAAAASATLTLTFAAGIPGPCTIKAGFRFGGPNSMQYEAVADKALTAQGAGYTTTLDVRQGQTRELNFVGDGTQFQVFRLDYANGGETIADESVRVWVDGAEWTENAFLQDGATNQFEVDYHAVPPVLRFGDGNAGVIPGDGANIRVQFVKIFGALGNVGENRITTVLDVLYYLGTAVPFTATNLRSAASGRDAETIEHAKRWAPYVFASRNGAVTGMDYQALSNSFVDPLYGAVAQAFAFTPREAYTDPVFNGYITAISGAVTTFQGAVTTGAADLTTDVGTITTQVNAIEAARANMVIIQAALENAVLSMQANASILKGTLLANAGNIAAAVAAHTEAGDQLDLLETYANTSLVPPEQTAVLGYVDAIRAANEAAITSTTAINNAELTALGQIAAFVEAPLAAILPTIQIGTSVNLADELADQLAAEAAINVPLVDILATSATLVAAGNAVEVASDANLALIGSRIGEVYDNSCRSNVVQVSILSVDSDGDYVAPPSGLIANLQTYLDQYKETTQWVEVIDGSPSLVSVDILIRYSLQDGYVAAETESDMDATVRSLMRGREYEEALWLSDIYRYVRASSDGLSYVNITLTSAVNDADGNAVPDATQVLILGTLTLTEV